MGCGEDGGDGGGEQLCPEDKVGLPPFDSAILQLAAALSGGGRGMGERLLTLPCADHSLDDRGVGGGEGAGRLGGRLAGRVRLVCQGAGSLARASLARAAARNLAVAS
jgi:hypothetical protein